MPGIYRPRHPERIVLYRVLFHHFERFLADYERRFEKEYGYFRPIVKEVVERYLDCGNPRSGFARIRGFSPGGIRDSASTEVDPIVWTVEGPSQGAYLPIVTILG